MYHAQVCGPEGVSPLTSPAQRPGREDTTGAGPTHALLSHLQSLLSKMLAHVVLLLLLVGGNSSDSDTDVGTTVLNLQPRARRFLPEQFSKRAPQPYKMEWKNEVDVDSGPGQPCTPAAPHSKDGGTQTPGMLRQPLLSKGQFGPVQEDSGTEGVRPKPPPRLVRRASEPGNRKARFGSEKP